MKNKVYVLAIVAIVAIIAVAYQVLPGPGNHLPAIDATTIGNAPRGAESSASHTVDALAPEGTNRRASGSSLYSDTEIDPYACLIGECSERFVEIIDAAKVEDSEDEPTDWSKLSDLPIRDQIVVLRGGRGMRLTNEEVGHVKAFLDDQSMQTLAAAAASLLASEPRGHGDTALSSSLQSIWDGAVASPTHPSAHFLNSILSALEGTPIGAETAHAVQSIASKQLEADSVLSSITGKARVLLANSGFVSEELFLGNGSKESGDHDELFEALVANERQFGAQERELIIEKLATEELLDTVPVSLREENQLILLARAGYHGITTYIADKSVAYGPHWVPFLLRLQVEFAGAGGRGGESFILELARQSTQFISPDTLVRAIADCNLTDADAVELLTLVPERLVTSAIDLADPDGNAQFFDVVVRAVADAHLDGAKHLPRVASRLYSGDQGTRGLLDELLAGEDGGAARSGLLRWKALAQLRQENLGAGVDLFDDTGQVGGEVLEELDRLLASFGSTQLEELYDAIVHADGYSGGLDRVLLPHAAICLESSQATFMEKLSQEAMAFSASTQAPTEALAEALVACLRFSQVRNLGERLWNEVVDAALRSTGFSALPQNLSEPALRSLHGARR